MKIAAQHSRRAAYYRLVHIYTRLGRFASCHQAYVVKIFMRIARPLYDLHANPTKISPYAK